MKKPIIIIALIAAILLFIIGTFYSENNSAHENEAVKETQTSEGTTQSPSQEMVTMIDLGATGCIPCKMMAPIIEELKKEYQGKASIVFIDVWKNPSEAQKYRIQAIPTQIFIDKDGNEVSRHTGFLDKKSIIAMLEKLGVK